MSLPKKLPSTQSVFYMKLITYSYYQAINISNSEQNTNIPLNVVNSFNVLGLLKNITKDILFSLSNSLVSYLLLNNGINLNKLTEYYKKDKMPRNFGKINNI